MASHNRKRMRLEEMRGQASESGVDAIEIDLGDDVEPVVVYSPFFMDDDHMRDVDAVQSDDDKDTIDMARAIVGDEAYERLREHGGRAGDVMLAYQQLQNRMQQATTATGRPTR